MTSYSLKRAHFHWLFALALLLIPAAAPAKNLDSLLNVLDKCLLERDIYETPKNEKAQQLKELATKTKDKAKALNAWVELSYLEQTRHSDEAITACENGYALARQLGDLPTAASLVLRKALVLGMSGLPWEAKTLLETAYSDQKLRPYLRERNYYLMYYNNFEFYNAYSLPTSLLNRNANIMKHLEDSIRSQQTDAAQLAMTFNYSSYKVTDMIAALKQRLYEVGEEDKGVVANTIANKYHLINNVPRRDYYWAKAAIYNVRCGRRENEASSVWRHAWRKLATGAAPRSTPAKPPKMPPSSTHAPACWSSIRHWSTSRNTTSKWLKNAGNGPAGATRWPASS